jgi:hypothetical protein
MSVIFPSSRPLTVLMTNMVLQNRTGTEVLILDTARLLLEFGHKPIVYTPHAGPLADEIRALSVPVVEDITSIGQPIDVIHGHHWPPLMTAIARFPLTPALFFCHDFVSWLDAPPLMPSIWRYLAVDETVQDRLLAHGAPPDRVCLHLNAPDQRFFSHAPPLSTRPRRALAFAKNLNHLAGITEACQTRGIALDVVGTAVDRPLAEPEKRLTEYDLVFASALTAMEAMALGRAVVVCDGRGLAGFATLETYNQWRPLNFGLRTLRKAPTADNMGAAIDRYDAEQAKAVSARIIAEGGRAAQVKTLVSLYRQAIAEQATTPPDPSTQNIALARHMQQWAPRLDARWPWLVEREALLGEIGRLKAVIPGTAHLGEAHAFGTNQHPNWWRPISGFHPPEAEIAWTRDTRAELSWSTSVPENHDLSVTLTLAPLLAESLPRSEVEVLVNGRPLVRWTFTLEEDKGGTTRTMTIPHERLSEDGILILTLLTDSPRRPCDLGLNADIRLLGLGLISAHLEAVPTQ